MIYIILTYLFSPFLYLFIAMKKRKTISRILVIQTAKIGDLICSTPIFREVKKKYPHASITAMINPVTEELLVYNPYVNKVIAIKNEDYRGFSGKIWLSNLICKGNYDIGICLNPNVPFAIALFWGLVPIRLSVMPDFSGFTFKLASVFFTYLEKHARGRMVIETYINMLKFINIETNDITKEVYAAPDAEPKAEQILAKTRQPLIGIAVSSGNRLKELETEKIANLIDIILDNINADIVLIGSNHDRNTASVILDLVSKKDKTIDATGRLNLSELPALIERLSLFIGVDTGITYMADALSVPIIHLAGPIDTSEQHPIGEKVIIIQNKLPCVPCTYVFKAAYACRTNTRECVRMIKIEDIVRAAAALLEKRSGKVKHGG